MKKTTKAFKTALAVIVLCAVVAVWVAGVDAIAAFSIAHAKQAVKLIIVGLEGLAAVSLVIWVKKKRNAKKERKKP